MDTQRERLRYLSTMLEQLNQQIKVAGREDEYIEMAKSISGEEQPALLIDDDTWQLMLPKEKEKNLLHYYHTLRLEHQVVTQQLRRLSTAGMVKEFLDSPYIKVPLTISGLVKLAEYVVELGSSMGLFYQENEGAPEQFWQ